MYIKHDQTLKISELVTETSTLKPPQVLPDQVHSHENKYHCSDRSAPTLCTHH